MTRTCPPAASSLGQHGPVIAFQDGQRAFSVGAAGGSTIITTILQIIMNHVDFGMSLPAASRPRG